MQCPTTSELEKLLHGSPLGSPLDADLSAICDHLSQCTSCQAELDRLSGDSDMKAWRKSTPAQTPFGDNQLFRAALERAAKLDTDVDSQDANATLSMSASDPLVALKLEPSVFAGDLGQLANYRIVREIGRGGSAIVFEAIDTQLDRRIAVKLLRPESQATQSLERFLREAKAIALVRHPNVVAIHSITATHDNLPVIAMELADGGCLQQRIEQHGGLPPRQAADWIAQVADGLATVHNMGLIHRDIKPSNVLLMHNETSHSQSAGESQEVAKLADFGLARLVDVANRETQTGMLLGTPAYMSPEHITSFESVDARSDIYCLGATFYESLTGEPPYRGALPAVLQQIEHDEPTSPRKLNSDIPADLETICLKAMQRERGKRYATAAEFSADLRRYLAGEPIQARPVTSAEKLWRWCHRNPGISSLTATVASLLTLLAIGSTYAAISINGVQNKLRNEKENVDQANRVIQATASDLEQQRQIALESLNSLVTKVQSELAARPGTLKLRESILQTALEGLDKVTKNAGTLSAAHTTIEAHLRKGELLDLLGKTADAIAEFETAATLARSAIDSLSQGHPSESSDAISAQRDLGNALFMQAEVHRKAFAYDLSEPIYQRVLAIRRAVADKLPDDLTVQLAWVTTLQRLADIHFYRSDWAGAEAAYGQVLQAAQQTDHSFPKNLTVQRSLAIAYERLGTLATTVGQLDKAQISFNEVLKLNQSLLAAEPENSLYRADLAYITKRLASLASARSDHQQAVSFAKEAIERYIEIANSDPQDADAQMKVGSGWETLYQVELAAGHLAEASAAISSSLQIFDNLAKQFPTASKYSSLAMESLTKLADAQARMGQFADSAESLAQYLKSFEGLSLAADANAANHSVTFDLVTNTQKSLKLAAEGIQSLDRQHQATDDVTYLAQAYIMYYQARNGQSEDAMQRGDQLKDYHGKDLLMASSGLLAMARGYAAVLSTIEAKTTDKENPELVQARQDALNHCLTTLDSLLEKNPAMREFLRGDYDFRNILKSP